MTIKHSPPLPISSHATILNVHALVSASIKNANRISWSKESDEMENASFITDICFRRKAATV